MHLLHTPIVLSLLLINISFMYSINFDKNTVVKGVQVSNDVANNNVGTIKFTKEIITPLSVSIIEKPISRSEIRSLFKYSVHLPIKDRKTAIGFVLSNKRENRYLTPDYVDHNNYISMGGAGFIYPKKKKASRGYAIGDIVGCTLDFSGNEVIFSVNGVEVGRDQISSDVMYAIPTISCEGGDVDAVITFDS